MCCPFVLQRRCPLDEVGLLLLYGAERREVLETTVQCAGVSPAGASGIVGFL